MNKTLTFIIIIAVAILLWFGVRASDSQRMQTNNETESTIAEEQQTENQDEAEALPSENNITSAQVSYTAQKVFFNQPTQQVTGVTADVTGTVSYHDALLSGTANVSTDNLTTDSKMRDSDVRKLLGATITAEIPETEITESGSYELPVSITIHDVTKTLVFTTEVVVDDTEIALSGHSDFLISDFGLTAPSAFEIYTVDDQAQLQFDIIADITA